MTISIYPMWISSSEDDDFVRVHMTFDRLDLVEAILGNDSPEVKISIVRTKGDAEGAQRFPFLRIDPNHRSDTSCTLDVLDILSRNRCVSEFGEEKPDKADQEEQPKA